MGALSLAAAMKVSAVALADICSMRILANSACWAMIAPMGVTAIVDRLACAALGPSWLRPVNGATLVIPLAALSPLTISTGDDALNIDIAARPGAGLSAMEFILNVAASIVALGLGRRALLGEQ